MSARGYATKFNLLPRGAVFRALLRDNLIDSIGISGITELINRLTGDPAFNVYSYIAEFDGTERFSCASITGATVTAQYPTEGGATITVGTGEISVSAGLLSWFTTDQGEKYVLQSNNTYRQDTFYDQNGIGDPLVLVAGTGTLPLCTATAVGSLLLAYGAAATDSANGTELVVEPNFADADGIIQNTAGMSIADGILTLQLTTTENQYFCTDIDLNKNYEYIIIATVSEISSGGRFALGVKNGGDFPLNYRDVLLDAVGTKTFRVTIPSTAENVGVKRVAGTPSGSMIKLSHFSIQKVLSQFVPGNPSTGLSATGAALTTEALILATSPALIEAIDMGGWYEADTAHGVGQYFNADESAKKVSPAYLRQNFENTEFFINNSIVVYGTEQNSQAVTKIGRYFKTTIPYYQRLSSIVDPTSISLGMLTDSHYYEGIEAATEEAIDVFYDNDVHGIIHAGDVHDGVAKWITYTPTVMYDQVPEYEDLYLGIDADQVIMVPGNRDQTITGFDPYLAISKYARKTNSILIGNYRIIGIHSALSPTYSTDTECLDYLTAQLAAANAAGNHVIIVMHVPPTAELLNAADFTTVISTAVGAGAVIRCIVTGHLHAWGQDLDFGGLGIPRISLNAISNAIKPYYVMDIDADSMVVREFTTSGEATKLTVNL